MDKWSENSESTIFDKADWLKGVESFDSFYSDVNNHIYVEAPVINDNVKYIELIKASRNVLIGRNTYKKHVGLSSPNVVIGRYCSISHFTHIGATHHHMDYLTTGTLNSPYYGEEFDADEDPYTIIGCDVWIGVNATIIGGATIGHGACIGAGSVVKKDIPPYAIAVGSPAKVIKNRFSDEIISDLLELKWWTLSPELINTLPYKEIKACITELKGLRQIYPTM